MPTLPPATTSCCIAGGGPAGMVLGYLLARAGVPTVVLEKHADFLRDFRGDTVHPSTLRILDELGLLDRCLQRPHQRLQRLGGCFGSHPIHLADFSGLPSRHNFIALMPQWDFLDFLATEARKLPAFTLVMQAEVTGLIEAEGRVAGVRGNTPAGGFELRADCTVGCDGRGSTVRQSAQLQGEDLAAPIDVLWFRVGRNPAEADDLLFRAASGHMVVTIDRGDYWQCAFVVPKGGASALKQGSIETLRSQVTEAAPPLAPQLAAALRSWDDVKLLTVKIDRLKHWSRPGLLCIGDAAHAMSPVGGVGINLAVQDAVATANALAAKLLAGCVSAGDLTSVQRRRDWPTRITQRLQIQMQDHVLVPVIHHSSPDLKVPWPLAVVSTLPPLQRLVARVIGLGFRPERVTSPRA